VGNCGCESRGYGGYGFACRSQIEAPIERDDNRQALADVLDALDTAQDALLVQVAREPPRARPSCSKMSATGRSPAPSPSRHPATALAGSGEIEQSHDALCEILERMPAEHTCRLAIVAACAGVELLLGHHRDARTRLILAYRSRHETRSPVAVLLQIELAAATCYEERFEEMLAWAGQAREGAALLGQRPTPRDSVDPD